MSETWNGATREEFIGRVKGFTKKELTDMMRVEGKRLPHTPPRATHEDLVGLCFDVLVGKDSGPAAGAPSSAPTAGAARFEIRARGVPYRTRCGQRFTNHGETYPANAFTPAEWERLKADPYLQVKDLTRSR